jgi:hypothetical protein
MSQARIKNWKRRKPWWIWMLQALGLGFMGLVFILCIAMALKSRFFDFVGQAIFSDTKMLFLIILNVFVIGGFLLVFLFHWADRERARFRDKQKAYRSMLVCNDYYRSAQRIKLDSLAMDMPENIGQRKIDIDYDLKTSSCVAVDNQQIAREAKKTHIAFDENNRLSGLFKTYFSNGNLLASKKKIQRLRRTSGLNQHIERVIDLIGIPGFDMFFNLPDGLLKSALCHCRLNMNQRRKDILPIHF